MNNNILSMKLNDTQLATMVAWCKANNIAYDVIGANGFSTPLPSFSTTSESTTDTTPEKPSYTATKDFVAKYEVKKQTVKGTTKSLYCISRANGWTKAEKACMNDRIKALDGIKTIEVEYTDKNGKTRSFNAWGYDTKKKAEEMMSTLDTNISVKELNARF